MPQDRNRTGQTIETSLFYMWRCVAAIAHADGHVSDAEKAYLRRVFAGLDRLYGLTADQRQTLENDLETPQRIGDLLRYVNDPAARAQLIYFGNLLAYADGHLHPEEKAILDKLRADQLASLDLETLRRDVRQAVDDEMLRHDLRMQDLLPDTLWARIIDSVLLEFGIDIYA